MGWVSEEAAGIEATVLAKESIEIEDELRGRVVGWLGGWLVGRKAKRRSSSSWRA